MLQCAVDVLQCVAVRGSVLQLRLKIHRARLRMHSALYVLQCVAVCCSVLQRVAVAFKDIWASPENAQYC